MSNTSNQKANGSVDNVIRLSLTRSIKHRLPWLVIGLVGGILASRIVVGFENTLKEDLILAAFIPLIVYMSDAVGTQMESFAIRDLAMHQSLNFSKYFFKQLGIVTIISSILSAGLFLFILIVDHSLLLSFAVSLAMFISIESSVFTGLILPRLFSRYRLDPANASGPTATIIQDLLSILIYFTIASLLL